ncbi:DUF3102 domain-containing protein [Solibacillus sp. FSL K6-1523]|uniref:DUF3102 domain-containing protein n=1 Tax=Solibacillus sp. FSL K6-1523 TaxID=2921471 RepID=UPI0030FC3681
MTLQFELGRPKEVIAGEINAIKVQTQTMVLQASSEIGKRLIEVKEQLPHGEWGQWLKDNVEYSQSTANNLMQIHHEYKANSQAFGDLTYTKAVALLGIDPGEREEFAKEVNAEEISTRELQKLIKEKQAIEKEKQELEAQMAKEKAALEEDLEQMQLQLEEVQQQVSSDEDSKKEINRLTQELAVAESTAERLQADLKAKPIEAKAVEIVPESVQKELEQLRKQAAEQGADPLEVAFKVKFETLINQFGSTLEAAELVTNTEKRKQFKQMVHKLLDRMRISLEEGDE